MRRVAGVFTVTELFNLDYTVACEFLKEFTYPWEALSGIKNFILKLGETLDKEEYDNLSGGVWVHKSARISPSAYLGEACIIGAGSEVRHCAYLRGSVLVGKNCVVGNSTELKNVILFDNVQVPHYNYVGDSILGYKSHLGAGAVTSNVKADRSAVTIKGAGREFKTGLKKLGAMIGDGVEVGCNSVLNPGTVIGRNTVIYPLSFVRGIVPADSIFKIGGQITAKR